MSYYFMATTCDMSEFVPELKEREREMTPTKCFQYMASFAFFFSVESHCCSNVSSTCKEGAVQYIRVLRTYYVHELPLYLLLFSTKTAISEINYDEDYRNQQISQIMMGRW